MNISRKWFGCSRPMLMKARPKLLSRSSGVSSAMLGRKVAIIAAMSPSHRARTISSLSEKYL